MTTRLRPHVHAWCAAALLCAAAAFPLAAQGLPEYQVKGAFLLNFVKFVEWPASAFQGPQSPAVICLAGRDPFDGALHALVQGERAGERPLEVRILQQPGAGAAGCHLLFVPAGQPDAQRFLAPAAAAPVLTVGEDSEALRRGCVIAFEIQDRRVRFAINPRAASDRGLRLSARLLQVARVVEPDGR